MEGGAAPPGPHRRPGLAGRPARRGGPAGVLLPALLGTGGRARRPLRGLPGIGTGFYGHPLEAAAEVALSSIALAPDEQHTIEEVVRCCFSTEALALHERLLA